MSLTIALNQRLESAFRERNAVLAELPAALGRFLKRQPPTREPHSPTEPVDVIGLFNPHGYRPTFDDIEPTLEHIVSLAHKQKRRVVLLVENNGGSQTVMRVLLELPFEQLEAVILNQDGSYSSTLKKLFHQSRSTDEEPTSLSEVHRSGEEHEDVEEHEDIEEHKDIQRPYIDALYTFIRSHPEMIIVQEQIPFPAWLAELREKLWNLIAQKCAHSGDAQRYEESLVARVGFIAESRGLRDRHVVDEQLKEVATKWPNGIIVILRGNAHHRLLDRVDPGRYRCLIAHTFSLDPEWHEPVSWVGNWSADHPDFILSPAVRAYMTWQQAHIQAMDQILKDPSVQNLRSEKEKILSGMSKVFESDVLSQLRRDASPFPAGLRVLEVAT